MGSLIADLFSSPVHLLVGTYGCKIWGMPFLQDCHLRDRKCQRHHCSGYKHALGVCRSTSSLLVLLGMGRFHMQINALQRAINYWKNLVADKADRRLLTAGLTENLWYG